tara:strand:+ start:468 stop:641 length:174 start_codon:yes stop_codon:yes gene_type:complete
MAGADLMNRVIIPRSREHMPTIGTSMRMYFAVRYLKYGISASFSDGKSDSIGMVKEG